jgi:FSR family fosmidomycin resistance protein-like MFS transporter
MPWLIPVAMCLGGAGIASSGLGDSYPLTLFFAAVSGLGVAAYHPEAARTARIASEGSHTSMAYFSTGGNIGFATAPLLVAAFVARGGLDRTPFLVLPALVGAAVTLPVITRLHRARGSGTSPHLPTGRDDVPAFVRLSFAVIFRSITFVGLSTFIALYAPERTGGGTTSGTAALFVLYLGGVVGSVLGGTLAQRWGRVAVTRWAYLVCAVAVTGVVWIPGPAIYLFIALTSVGLYVPFSLQITLGQDYLPSRVGTASGVTLGLTVSIGGLASPVLGAIADAASLQTALAPLAVMPVVSWILFRTLTEPGRPALPAARSEDESQAGVAGPPSGRM